MTLPEYSKDGCCYDLRNLLLTLQHFDDAATTREFLRIYYTSVLNNIPRPAELPVVGHECHWVMTMALPFADLATSCQLEMMIELIKTSS